MAFSTSGCHCGNRLYAWLYRVDRYVCASDGGEWCSYCEKDNDIAVIGLLIDVKDKFSRPIEALQATSIAFARQVPQEGKFRFDKLTDAWRTALVEEC